VPARRTEHLLIAQLLNPVAQLGSKCLYVLQSKAREGMPSPLGED